MKSKSSFKRPVFNAGSVGIVLLSIILGFTTLSLPSQDTYPKPPFNLNQAPENLIEGESVSAVVGIAFAEQTNSQLPARLTIPRIRVNAVIEQVGLTPQGAVDVPQGSKNVGWFNQGPLPGGKGTAIIDGHFGYWRNGAATVFNNLYKLKKGDKVSVVDDRGEATTFVVRELRTYGQYDDASDVFSSSDGESHLNLVTCEGSWDKVSRTYSNRLVVFADKEIG